jgi:hypothetical protein
VGGRGGCVEQNRFRAQARWQTALNGAFLGRFDAKLREAGIETANRPPPGGGGDVRRDKFGLAPGYPSRNAPHDVLVDFFIGQHGYTPVRTEAGVMMYSPFLMGTVRLIDGETGMPFAQRHVLYGPVYLRRAKALWVQPSEATFVADISAVVNNGAANVAALRTGAELAADAAAAHLLSLVEAPAVEVSGVR